MITSNIEITPIVTHGPRALRLLDLLDEWTADATVVHEARANGQPRGPITGLPKIDASLGGAFQPGMHIIHGQPGTGKTAFALQIACNCGCPCLFITCEMHPLELFRRVTARTTGMFLGRLKSGELSPDESVRLARRAAQEHAHLVIADATQQFLSPEQMERLAEAVRSGSQKLLVIVDSLHSWVESCPEYTTEYEALNSGLSALRGVAARLASPVLAVAERNRGLMEKGGLSAGAGTRKIEYGSETVLDLQRDPKAMEDANGEVAVTLCFAKNRNGAAGKKVELMFHGALQRFQEATYAR